MSIRALLRAYSAFNPHATFTLRQEGQPEEVWSATDAAWRKWKPSTPTSPHWYSVERLRDLIAAYIGDERNGGRSRTVREFVAEFNGLSSPPKQKTVLVAADLSRARLSDLASDGRVDLDKVAALLAAMQRETRPIKPAALGVLGESHLTQYLVNQYQVHPDSVSYSKKQGEDDGKPFVAELALGVLTEASERRGRELISGMNWAASIKMPFQKMLTVLGQQRVDVNDPLVVITHVAKPGIQFSDRGKGVVGDV